MSGSVAVVLVGVVVAAARSEEQAGEWEQHDAAQQHGSQIEAGESGVHAVLDGILSLAGLTPACSPLRGLC